MNCEDLFKRIAQRQELADVPLVLLAKVSIVAFEEFKELANEAFYVETLQS